MRLCTSGKTMRGAWYIVGVLAVLLSISYFDRFILALLADPVSQDLTITDGQMGLLLGFGFVVLFGLAGLPVACYLDRGNRIRGVAAGVIVWSLSTSACAFADSFTALLVLRAGVAMGEAVLTPSMVSLIGDLFEPRDRGRPTGVYLSIGIIMGGGAFIAGGFAVQLVEWVQNLGFFVGLATWRLTFFLVGLPGLFMALLLLATVREPARRSDSTAAEKKDVSASSVFAHLRSHAKFYVPFLLLVGFGNSIGYAAYAWVPTILVRSYGLDVSSAGYAFGVAAVPIGVMSTMLWSWLAGRSIGFSRAGPLSTMLLAIATMLASGVALLLWDTVAVTVVAAAVMVGGSACFMPVCALVVQHAAPSRLHAQLTAVMLLALTIVGHGVGPLAPPVVVALAGDETMQLRHATVMYALVAGCVLFLALIAGRRTYERLGRGGRALGAATVSLDNQIRADEDLVSEPIPR